MRSLRRLLRFPVPADDDGSRWLGRLWPLSAANVLVSLSFGVFVAQKIIGPGRQNPLETWGALTGAALRDGQLWRLGTHLFLHDNPVTLLVNALLLYFAGRNLEAIIGRRHLLAIFLLGGSLGGLVRAAGVLYLPFETARAATLAMGSDMIMGAGGGAMAVLLAFTLIMPELELGALVYLPAPTGRLRAKDFTIGALLGPALLFAIFQSPLAIPPDTGYAWRLACAGALAGALSGWVYARALGFGQRWSSRRPPRPGEAFAGVLTASARTVPAASGAPPEPSTGTAASWSSPAGAAATTATTAAAPQQPSVSRVNAGPMVTGAAPAAVNTHLSERERRMTAREYITEAADPILDKIAREGLASLSEAERRVLQTAREKMAGAGPGGSR